MEATHLGDQIMNKDMRGKHNVKDVVRCRDWNENVIIMEDGIADITRNGKP